MQATPAKGTQSTTSTTAKMASSVNSKKSNTTSNQSPKVNTVAPQSVQGTIASPAKTVSLASTLPGTKSPISALVQKSTPALTSGKTLTVQSALQNAALSSVAQSITGNKVIQVTTGTQLKTVLPGQLRANTTALIRPAAPGVVAAQRANLTQPVISLQRPVVPGQTAIKVNSVAGKPTTAVSGSQGTTPTQYALVRAQIPGTGGGPPQTVTFIRAISPGGQAASGGATVTVTPQQMAALLRGQTTALKGTAQSQIRTITPSTQGGTTAGLSTIKPVVATTTSQAAANNPKLPVGKQIIQIAAAQLAANQASGSATSPGVPVVAKVNLAGLTGSPGAVVSQTPTIAPAVSTVPTATTLSQTKDLSASGVTSTPGSVKNSNPASKNTAEQAKNVGSKSSEDTALVNSVVSTPTIVAAEAAPESKSQVTSTGRKEVPETTEGIVDSSSLPNKPSTSSDADSTTSNIPTSSEKGDDTADKEKEALDNKPSDGEESSKVDLPSRRDSSQDLLSAKGIDFYVAYFICISITFVDLLCSFVGT